VDRPGERVDGVEALDRQDVVDGGAEQRGERLADRPITDDRHVYVRLTIAHIVILNQN
jgi:hypothetical protein